METAVKKAAPSKTSEPAKGPEESFFRTGQESSVKDAFFNTGAQAKLTVGAANDSYEKQADAVADKVVNKINTPPVQAKGGSKEEEQLQKKEEQEEKGIGAVDKKIQKQPVFESDADPAEKAKIQTKGGEQQTASSGLQSQLNSSKGGGQPLPENTKQNMESAFGADFSGVKVHTGNESAKMNQELGSQAFAHGGDVYFNEGKYNPGSKDGDHLLAHELTHTIQQGAAVQKKEDPDIQAKTNGIQTSLIQKKGEAPAAAGPVQTVDISKGTFHPNEKLAAEIEDAGYKGLDVNLSMGALGGSETVKITGKKGRFDSRKKAKIPLNIPYLSAASPTLHVGVDAGNVKGKIGTPKSAGDLDTWIQKNAASLGWTGIDIKSMEGKLTNDFDDGKINLSINGVSVKLGGFATATLTAGFQNLLKPFVKVEANVQSGGIADASLTLTNETGPLTGSVDVGVTFASFSGSVTVAYKPDGSIDIKGTVGYTGNKLSGSLTLIATDKATADNFAKAQLGTGSAAEAAPPAEVPAPGAKPGPRALAGMGTLTFNLTDWFAGTVSVIVDGKGDVTVVGKIAPPKEIELFPQKNFDKELFKMEARASYGIPVVGNVFVFANVALIAMARVGPAKIYNIEIEGTYSTDPGIAKSITIAGSLNMSAYAGLRLRAEGGVGLTILGHDIKLGVGVNADAGVKGYVDARPTIGYRDPGEFFFKGHMEIAAQPFLGLSGDLFVELDSPWWSPAPDKKWTWPIGSLEYPLPGEFGIGADMEYVLGSGKVPEISFGKADFDGGKFMTDLVDNNVPSGGGKGKQEKPGKFVDGGAKGASPKPAPPPAGGDKKGAPAKGGGKGKDKKGKDANNNDELKQMDAAMKKVKELEQGKPLDKAGITKAINAIKAAHRVNITFKEQGKDLWMVSLQAKGKAKGSKTPAKVKRKPGDDAVADSPEKQKKLDAGIAALKDEDKKVAGDGKLNKEEAGKVASTVKGKHSDVFKSITVKEGGKNWKYHYVQKKEGDVTGSEEEKEKLPDWVVKGAYIKTDSKILKVLEIGADKIQLESVNDEGKLRMGKNKASVIKSIVTDKTWVQATADEVKQLMDSIFPDVRVFPGVVNGDVIRDHYESFGWSTHSKGIRDTQVPGMISDIQNAQNTKNKAEFDKMKAIGWVPVDASINTYDPTKEEFHVDHEPDLSIRWNGTGRDNDDAHRQVQLTGPKLRVVCRKFNLSKPKTKYVLNVGRNFSSAKLNSPKGSKTIMGAKYKDTSGKELK